MSIEHPHPAWARIAVRLVLVGFAVAGIAMVKPHVIPPLCVYQDSAARFEQYQAALDLDPGAPADMPQVFAPCRVPVDGLARWQAAGIRFEGRWSDEELTGVVKVLDRFAATFGEERFVALTQHALRAAPEGKARYLTIAKIEHPRLAPGSWSPLVGKIFINTTLYDQAYMNDHYRWSILDSVGQGQDLPITPQDFVLAHELGHVLIDGAHVAQDLDRKVRVFEEKYKARLAKAYWPHPRASINENLASEIGLWALDGSRPETVAAFREAHLAPYLMAPADRDTDPLIPPGETLVW